MEKLWTTTEVAKYLGVSEEEVEGLVREGRLTGYKLGGQFLRFRPDQVQGLRGQLGRRRPQGVPGTTAQPMIWQERVRDFIYFYDFYILSFLLLIGVMIYLMSSG